MERLKSRRRDQNLSGKRSGVDCEGEELQKCLDYVREGDTLQVTKLDRLARSTANLYAIATTLESKGVAFKVLDNAAVDTASRTGKLVMGILALIAEFKRDPARASNGGQCQGERAYRWTAEGGHGCDRQGHSCAPV
ncbi:recombinase family protein [Phyllobacterium sp. UNC302MFCol5.2]|uniref:recombinase family protein n=1 Tax=Phyllobacterium sp. UNC302MFCol5.2 TaxID=1449065 RepID=UPI00068B1F42|nr:recombinase family protein [Phyllobacterium sp. UNC302MFCol5.2]